MWVVQTDIYCKCVEPMPDIKDQVGKKKVSSSCTKRADSEQRVGSLSPKAKGFSGMWFQRKSHSRDLPNWKLNFVVDPSGQAMSSVA